MGRQGTATVSAVVRPTALASLEYASAEFDETSLEWEEETPWPDISI